MSELQINWLFPTKENVIVNEVINAARLAHENGEKWDTATLHAAVVKLVRVTRHYTIISEPPQAALVYYCTGCGNTGNKSSHVTPFCSPEMIRRLIDHTSCSVLPREDKALPPTSSPGSAESAQEIL